MASEVGIQSFVARISFRNGGCGRAPQTATCHIVKRYGLWAGFMIFLPIFVEILLQNDHN